MKPPYDPDRNHPSMSIRLKTIIGIVLIQTTALAIVVGVNLDILVKSNDQLLSDQARAVASLAAESAWARLQVSQEEFDSEIKRIREADPRIKWVVVRTPEEMEDPLPENDGSVLVQTVQLSNDVMDQDWNRVEVTVALDRSSMVATRNSALVRSVGIALLEIIASIAFSLWLASWLLGRLSNLQMASQRISEGDFAQRVPVTGKDEISDTAVAFNTMAGRLSVLVDQVREESSRRESIEAELRVAREIQDSLHPATFPSFPGLPRIDVEAVDDPVREVGGDFYDWFALDEKTLAIVIADVVGKGLAAGLFAAACKTVVRTLALTGLSPATTLKRANEQLAEQNPHQMFATLMLLHLDAESGRINGAIAGHPAGRIIRADGSVDRVLERTGPILGVIPDAAWEEIECTLDIGDRLVLVTDGVLEASNQEGTMLDDSGLDSLLESAGDLDSTQTARRIAWSVRTREGDAPKDDVTIVVVKRMDEVDTGDSS